jgi:hypothetical protein
MDSLCIDREDTSTLQIQDVEGNVSRQESLCMDCVCVREREREREREISDTSQNKTHANYLIFSLSSFG